MLKVTITREHHGDTGTFGRMRIAGMDFTCLTGELPYRDNTPDKSCTKAGVYRTDLRDSPHFGRPVYHLEDRDGRKNEEIHWGNFCGDVDKGFRSDVLGCIILGNSIGDVMRPDKVFQKGVAQSHDAFNRFMAATGGAEIEITII